MYVLDTNTLIYYFKGMGQVGDRLREVSPTGIAISTLVLYELQVGIAKSASPERRIAQLNAFIEPVNVLAFDLKAAQSAALIRASLEQQGQPIGPLDTLIAGVALSQSAILVTHNTREFSRIDGLQLADWY